MGVVYLAVDAGIAYYSSTRAWDTPQNTNIAKKNNLKVTKLTVKKFSKAHSSGTTSQALEGKSYMQTVQCTSTNSARYPVLVYGSSGEYVTTLQRHLAQYGYYSDRIDGNFGPNTDKAVRSFQRVNGLSVDGSVGPLTWEKILSGNVLAVEESKEGSNSQEEKGNEKARTVNPEGLTPEEEEAINDVLAGSKEGQKTKGATEQREKSGGYPEAKEDFDKIPLTEEKDINTQYGKGKTGKLSNGKNVTVRPGSSEGSPTLQIPEGASRQIEIRYK